MNARPDNSQYLERLNGTPVLLGTIVATTTKNNHDTSTPFNNTDPGLSGKVLLIVPSATCYINAGTTNAATATTSSVKLVADEKFWLVMGQKYGWLACVSDSGTTNLRVYELV